MAIPTVTINGTDYPAYADVAYATQFLNADAARAAPWTATSVDDQGRGLVTATRVLLSLNWQAGAPPSLDDAPDNVKQAVSILAADIAAKPTTGDGSSGGSNIKAVGAGSARVEFFAPVAAGSALSASALALLSGMLAGAETGPALDGTAYGSSDCQRSRFDPTEYELWGVGNGWVDPDERFF
jgi:hypothetical protein